MSPRSASRTEAGQVTPPPPPHARASRSFKVAVSVVVIFLVGQLAVSATGAVVGSAETEDAALDTFSRVGDLTAERVGRHAESARTVVEGTAARLGSAEKPLSQEQVATELYLGLEREPEVRAAYVGFPDGTFVFVERRGTGYVDRRVEDPDSGRLVERLRDVRFFPYANRVLDERYDPRGRPWYELGFGSQRTEWTEPFLLARAGTPGAVATRSVRVDNEVTAVVGADLSLHTLATVLDEIPVGDGAQAFILSPDRQVIAAPTEYSAQIADYIAEEGRVPTTADIGVTDAVIAESVHDGDVYGSLGDRYILERALPTNELVNWILHIEADEQQLSPGLSSLQLTMAWMTGLSLLIVALGSVLLYRLWRPLEELRLRASTDRLTGLANRHEFERRGERLLQAARRGGSAVLVATVDLDNFKVLNDTHGHDVGDKALTVTGQTLLTSMRDRDMAARFGGDEFVFLQRLRHPSHAHDVVERIRLEVETQLAARVRDGGTVGVTAGYSVSDHDQQSLMNLVRDADAALVAGKRTHKSATYAAPTQAEPPAEDRRA